MQNICIIIQDALVRSLINRFKKFCRPKKTRKEPKKEKAVMLHVGKAPGITNSVKEPVPILGENALNYERHTKELQVELKPPHIIKPLLMTSWNDHLL